MSTEIAVQPNEITLTIVNEHVTATSNQVAAHFKKAHKNVLQAIDNLECSDEFRGLNFAPTFQTVALPNGATRQDRSFTITRDGFAFLGMGFTGKEAAVWKEKYIKAYNAMETEIFLLQAENEALLKWNLTNCHGAITTLQDDNGVARRQVILPLQIERTKNERLTLQNARLDKQLELAKFHAANDDRDRVRKLERDVKMWRKGCAELEERMEMLEHACGITRDTPIFRAWKFKLA